MENKVEIIIPSETQLKQNLLVQRSAIDGLGLFAKKTYKPMDVIWSESASKKPENDGPLRWTNHSDDPNAALVLRNDSFVLIALREIPSGEEITYSYDVFGLHNGHSKTCKCGAPNCRGVFTLRTEWDETK